MTEKRCGRKPCNVNSRKRDSSVAENLKKFGLFFIIAIVFAAGVFFVAWGTAATYSVIFTDIIKNIDPAGLQWWMMFFAGSDFAQNIYFAAIYVYQPQAFFLFFGIISAIIFFVIWIIVPIIIEK